MIVDIFKGIGDGFKEAFSSLNPNISPYEAKKQVEQLNNKNSNRSLPSLEDLSLGRFSSSDTTNNNIMGLVIGFIVILFIFKR